VRQIHSQPDLVDFRLLVRQQGWEVEKSTTVENHLRLFVGARYYVTKSSQGSSLVHTQQINVSTDITKINISLTGQLLMQLYIHWVTLYSAETKV